MKEKEKKKEIDRFRFLILGAVFAFLIGIAANLFYDLLIGTKINPMAVILLTPTITMSLLFFSFLVGNEMKELGHVFPPSFTIKEEIKKDKEIFIKNKKCFLIVLFFAILIPILLYFRDSPDTMGL